jgi:hypothetical protein
MLIGVIVDAGLSDEDRESFSRLLKNAVFDPAKGTVQRALSLIKPDLIDRACN